MSQATTETTDKRLLDDRTREKLRTTILTLFSEGSFQDVGIRQICMTAKVSPKTVYKYFGNKEEMLFGCIATDLDRLSNTCLNRALAEPTLHRKFSVFIDIWCDFYFDNEALARIVFLNIPQRYWVGERNFIRRDLHNATLNLIAEGQKKGFVWNDMEPELLMDLMMGAAHRAMVQWLLSDQAPTAQFKQEIKTGLTRLFLKPGT